MVHDAHLPGEQPPEQANMQQQTYLLLALQMEEEARAIPWQLLSFTPRWSIELEERDLPKEWTTYLKQGMSQEEASDETPTPEEPSDTTTSQPPVSEKQPDQATNEPEEEHEPWWEQEDEWEDEPTSEASLPTNGHTPQRVFTYQQLVAHLSKEKEIYDQWCDRWCKQYGEKPTPGMFTDEQWRQYYLYWQKETGQPAIPANPYPPELAKAQQLDAENYHQWGQEQLDSGRGFLRDGMLWVYRDHPTLDPYTHWRINAGKLQVGEAYEKWLLEGHEGDMRTFLHEVDGDHTRPVKRQERPSEPTPQQRQAKQPPLDKNAVRAAEEELLDPHVARRLEKDRNRDEWGR
ncbi:MAG: hypothetical protein J2P37_31010 [Ktedonobacteraceae bacterium]|nr:hypothetical protein [Ktedonobacteraceae bacterium]